MGPLAGFRIVEFAGIGPGPMAAMLFADLGARVIRVDRLAASDLGIAIPTRFGLLARSRPAVAIDLKHPDGIALAADLAANADGLIEGFRPGTMERLGLGPDVLLARNPRLVYGRMTGWGQTGPLAQAAGHDLNYLALAGGLHAIGRAGAKPTPPLNLVADFGGGALYLAFGMACAMLEAQRSGKGQVVDAAMTEGAASLMTMFYGLYAAGRHSLERGTNLLDSGSAIYDVYECADGRFVSVAAIELKFRKVLFERLGLPYTTDEGPELREQARKAFQDTDPGRVVCATGRNGRLFCTRAFHGRGPASSAQRRPRFVCRRRRSDTAGRRSPFFTNAGGPANAAGGSRRRHTNRTARMEYSAGQDRRATGKRRAGRVEERARAGKLNSQARNGAQNFYFDSSRIIYPAPRTVCRSGWAKPLSILERSREMCTSITLVCGSK